VNQYVELPELVFRFTWGQRRMWIGFSGRGNGHIGGFDGARSFDGARRRQNSGARGGAGVARPLGMETARQARRRERRRQERETDRENSERIRANLEDLGFISSR
jgi:hypothetical protein